MVTRKRTSPDRRHSRPTRQVHWSKLTADEVVPGDVLAWGTVLAKEWGGPIGIEAWRFVIEGQHKPLWLLKGEIVHRRARVVVAGHAATIAAWPSKATTTSR